MLIVLVIISVFSLIVLIYGIVLNISLAKELNKSDNSMYYIKNGLTGLSISFIIFLMLCTANTKVEMKKLLIASIIIIAISMPIYIFGRIIANRINERESMMYGYPILID